MDSGGAVMNGIRSMVAALLVGTGTLAAPPSSPGATVSDPSTAASPARLQQGIASVYADRLDGRATASGEPYDEDSLTAAHRTLPFGTRVRVTHLNSQRSVTVRINDRGPVPRNRIIDLSPAAARAIGLRARKGVARVRLEVLHGRDAAAGRSTR
jgi:rare lipoprotein A